jgi:Uma2 family endonuclease
MTRTPARPRDGISPTDVIIGFDVPLERYLNEYGETRCEWVEGMVVQLAPAELRHNAIDRFLYALLDTYFSLRPIGKVIPNPFTLRQPAFPQRRREPDLMVVLNGNPGTLHPASFEGAPDVVIEIISPESEARDRGVKFSEYQQGGVQEYWLIAPDPAAADFYRLSSGVYIPAVARGGIYSTPLLPGLALDTALLRRDPPPSAPEAVRIVTAMLGHGEDRL